MPRRLTEPPKNWEARLVISAVPKDGSPYEDAFPIAAKGDAVSYWGQEYTLLSNLDAAVRAAVKDGSLVMRVSVSGSVGAPCSRCLEPARTEVSKELRYIFSLEQNGGEEEKAKESDGDEEMIALPAWEDEISLTPYIWEALIVSLPAVILCKPDCKGLCPICGANLNDGDCGCRNDKTDPRFEVLKKFIKDGGE